MAARILILTIVLILTGCAGFGYYGGGYYGGGYSGYPYSYYDYDELYGLPYSYPYPQYYYYSVPTAPVPYGGQGFGRHYEEEKHEHGQEGHFERGPGCGGRSERGGHFEGGHR